METDTLPNPVIQDDAIEAQLREASAKADAGESFELPSAEQSDTRADTTAADTSSPDITPEKTKDERPRDELGRFTKTEAGEDIPEDQRGAPVEEQPKPEAPKDEAKPEKPDSPYVKAQKDQERLNRNRQEFEQEKARERAAIEAERRAIAEERQRIQAEAAQRNAPEAPKYSAQEYAAFAKECAAKAKQAREAGDYEEAEKQAGYAAEASDAVLRAQEFEQTTRQQQLAQHYQQEWIRNMDATLKAEPELANRESPLGKAINDVLGEYGEVLERVPNGFKYGVEIAKLRLQAGAVSGLEKQLQEVTKERDELRQRTSLNGSGPTGPTPRKTIDQMSDDEAEAAIRRMSEGVPINF